MTRPTPSKSTTQPQATPAAPMTAEQRAIHRQRIKALPPGTPVVILKPGNPVITGLTMANARWSNLECIVTTRDGEHVRAPWAMVHPAISANRLSRIGEAPEEPPAAPAAEPQA